MRVKNTVALGLEYLALALAALAALGLSLIVGIIVTSVVMRKFANSPLHITEEVVGLFQDRWFQIFQKMALPILLRKRMKMV